jgi:chitin disaccharide deacetylase
MATATRNLIVNADDFGLTPGINRAVVDCHVDGIVTSASLMVERPAAEEAARLSREHPALSVGLHWDHEAAGERVNLKDAAALERELERQVERFVALVGGPPTHLDSHWHVHDREPARTCFRALADRLGVPLRGAGPVAHVGGFYAQWEWKVTRLDYVGVEFLCRLLREEVVGAWTELGCHPGYVQPELRSVYLHEREKEVRTLTDPRVKATVEEEGIALVGFRNVPTSTRGRR